MLLVLKREDHRQATDERCVGEFVADH